MCLEEKCVKVLLSLWQVINPDWLNLIKFNEISKTQTIVGTVPLLFQIILLQAGNALLFPYCLYHFKNILILISVSEVIYSVLLMCDSAGPATFLCPFSPCILCSPPQMLAFCPQFSLDGFLWLTHS